MKHILHKLLTLILLAGLTSCAAEGDINDGFYYPNFNEGAPSDTQENLGGDQFTDYGENDFIATATNPNSTFSVDADGASYSILRAYINRYGALPPAAALRTEELLNYFTFDYPEPEEGHCVSVSHEAMVCPWNTEHTLLRVGLKGIKPERMRPTNYVFMIDVSGSMDSNEKLPLLKEGLKALVEHLSAEDKISIVTYSGSVRALLEGVAGNRKEEIIRAIDKLQAGGSTNGGDALVMAYNLARSCYIPDGNNRVIIGTDGDFNVGMTSTEALVKYVEEQLQHNIYMSIMGFGLGNLNDSMMEKLAGHGNGTYDYIDSAEQMIKVYVNERERMQAVCKDTKIKIAFNPETVAQWRLIGYENRVMTEEEFEDSKKDAGEIGAGQTITALYELIPSESTDELPSETLMATCEVRYKDTNFDTPYSIDYNIAPTVLSNAEASSEIKWAASLAAMSMLSRQSKYAGSATIAMVESLAREGVVGDRVQQADPHGYRAAHLILLDKWSALLAEKK